MFYGDPLGNPLEWVCAKRIKDPLGLLCLNADLYAWAEQNNYTVEGNTTKLINPFIYILTPRVVEPCP